MAANSKKRKLEGRDVDMHMVEIYENLAHEDSKVRLSATRSLLSRFNEGSPHFTTEQYKTTITRLIRGLCSGRKAARLGFSVALAEFLSQTFKIHHAQRGITEKDLLKIVEQQTSPREKISGQDERDHLFGRLFAVDALVESAILLRPLDQLDLCGPLLDLVTGLARNKTWLRQECGWCLFKFVRSTCNDHVQLVEAVLQALAKHNMIRTPEGVAIWLLVKEQYPSANFPRKTWKHDDPLHAGEKTLLADVMRDAAPKKPLGEGQPMSEGSGLWSPQLHFSWDMVLQTFEKGNSSQRKSQRTSFAAFWEETIDRGLLKPSTSTERKHWAFLAAQKVVRESNLDMASTVLSTSFISCLKNHLVSTERTLHADAEIICQALQNRAAKDSAFATVAVTSLLGPAGKINFDKATRTRTVEKIIANASNTSLQSIAQFLEQMFIDRVMIDSHDAERTRQSIIDWLTFIFTQQESKPSSETVESWESEILLFMIRHAYFIPSQALTRDNKPKPPLSESTRTYLHLRLSNCLEQYLRHTGSAFARLYEVMDAFGALLQDPKSGLNAVLELDLTISNTANISWANLRSLSTGDDLNPVVTALRLLLCIALLQFYGGDGNAVSILEDVNEEISKTKGQPGKGKEDQPSADTDSIVETVLTLNSKPSKLLRRVGLLVFELIAPRITQLGLDSPLKVLCTKESLQGQGELFDIGEDLQESVSISAESDDAGASGVEILDQDENASSTSSSPSPSGDSNNDEELNTQRMDHDDETSSDPELAAFDAKLAAALKTHRGDEDLNASSASSDEDMSDSEMEAIDAQLAAVFAAQREASKSRQSKPTNQSARENIVNFKNRALDLIEIFFKSQKDNPLILASLSTVLSAARSTNSKQVAERIYQVLRAFNDRCKGKSHLPPCLDSAATLSNLRAIHEEAKQDASHAHSTACGNAAVLVVRVISHNHHQSEILEQIVHLYAESTKAFLLNGLMMPGFFTAWNNWYVQMKGPLAESKKAANAAQKHTRDDGATGSAKQDPKGRGKGRDTKRKKSDLAGNRRRKEKKTTKR
ncbi:MAG: hypothetical protein Q9160_006450 [Pyrenula sp. 1 TL-2023]